MMGELPTLDPPLGKHVSVFFALKTKQMYMCKQRWLCKIDKQVLKINLCKGYKYKTYNAVISTAY